MFQHDIAPVHKARSLRTWVTKSSVKELEWATLNPSEHLGDEMEHRASLWDIGAQPLGLDNNALLHRLIFMDVLARTNSPVISLTPQPCSTVQS